MNGEPFLSLMMGALAVILGVAGEVMIATVAEAYWVFY